jgi:nucleoside-diphosphate-sugar epimerase
MRVLVTGGSGFVGEPLIRKLKSRGHWVRAVGRKRPHTAVDEFLQIQSIGRSTDWTLAVKDIEGVCHLAARVHVLNDPEPQLFEDVNVGATESLVRHASSAGVSRFVFLSTLKVCGENSKHGLLKENDVHPNDPYAHSKAAAERILRQTCENSSMNFTIIRPPLVYGPGVRANFFRLMTIARRNVPIPLGGIKNRRSLIYVENLVDAIEKCLVSDAGANQIFLVSDGKPVSTPDLIRHLSEAFGRKVRLWSLPTGLMKMFLCGLGKSQQWSRLADSLEVDDSKIRKVLNWEAPYTMAQGLSETAKWFKSVQSS